MPKVTKELLVSLTAAYIARKYVSCMLIFFIEVGLLLQIVQKGRRDAQNVQCKPAATCQVVRPEDAAYVDQQNENDDLFC